MQYYNHGMKYGLEYNNINVYLFTDASVIPSNGNGINIYNYFHKVWSKNNILLRSFFYFVGLFRSFLKARLNQCNVAHLHKFHSNLQLLITILLGRLVFKKLILTVHDIHSFGKERKFIEVIYNSLLSLLVDKFIVHNNYSFSALSIKLKSKTTIIRHGNYILFFRDIPIRMNSPDFNLLFFGLIKESKGLDVLLESLLLLKKSVNNFHLTIAGRPWRNDFSNYEQFIRSNNLEKNISCHLFFHSEVDLLKHFENTDIVILPYKKIYQSGVVLKAMSLRRPVLCSNLTPFEDLINDGVNGFLFESENPISLANKLVEIYSKKNQLINIIECASRDLEENYSWEIIGLDLKNLYNEIYEY
jgi:glycosyltransferase involved in cell wall biosynthesis